MRKWFLVLIVVIIIAILGVATYFSSKQSKEEQKPVVESLKVEEVTQIQADFQRLLPPIKEGVEYEQFKSDVERLYDPKQIPEDIKQKLAELKEKKILAELKLYFGSEQKAEEELEKMKQSGEYEKLK